MFRIFTPDETEDEWSYIFENRESLISNNWLRNNEKNWRIRDEKDNIKRSKKKT